MYQWELDGPALQEFDSLPPPARQALAAFMDAVVIVDPLEYQRRDDEPAGLGKDGPHPALRCFHLPHL